MCVTKYIKHKERSVGTPCQKKQTNMPNTYSQIYLQFIFVVKGRENLIKESFREELQKYITGIIQNKGQKLLSIYANPDHIHFFVSFKKLDISVSQFVKEIKTSSTSFINEKRFVLGRFHWQEGYGCFSYAKSQKDTVVHYIENQKEHHKKENFRTEYLKFLKVFEIEYDERYLFEFYD